MGRVWRSLGGRLALLAVLSAVPALLLSIYGSVDARRQAMRHVGDEMLRLARVCAADQERQVRITAELLTAMALIPGLQGPDPSMQAVLDGVRERFPSYAALLVVGADGRTRMRSPQGPVVSVADRAYFHRSMAGDPVSVGCFAISRSTGRAALHCSVPLPGPHGPSGVLVAAIGLDQIRHIAGEVGLGADARTLVIDRSGVLLSAIGGGSATSGSMVDPDLWRHLGGEPGIFTQHDPDGFDRIYGFDLINDTKGDVIGWVAIGEPVAHAYAGIERRLVVGLLLVALTAVVAGLVARHLGRRMIIAPARDLAAAAGALAEGSLHMRCDPGRQPDELALVAASINALGTTLAADDERRRRDAQALHEAHMLLRTLVDVAPLAVYALDADGRIALLWSRGAEALFGWTSGESIGREPPHVQPDQHSGAHPRPLMEGETVAGVELSCRRRDGGLVRCVLYAAATRVGSMDVTVCLLADISDQYRLREQIQQVQKMEVVGRLAAGVAHDFNNLLAVIVGHCDLLLRRIEDPERRVQLDAIHGAARKAAALTGRLLGFARNQPMNPQRLSVGAHVEGAITLLQGLVGRQVRIDCDLARDIQVMADPLILDQVLMNLVLNARDAGATVIHVVVRGGSSAVIEVVDDGSGMTESVRARLFEPFFTTKVSGTGLGLVTVRSLIEAMGGTIAVASAPGRGATFTVIIPAAR